MEINKERSKKIVKLLSISFAVEMMISGTTVNADIDKSILEQIEYHNKQYELQQKINNLPESLYDKKYNDYCDTGKITINNSEYEIKHLHIEYGYIGEQKIVYLKDYHNPKIDIITGNKIDDNYTRKKVMSLKYSEVFYDYYCNQDKDLIEYINSFEGDINYMVPETFFYNPYADMFDVGEKVK